MECSDVARYLPVTLSLFVVVAVAVIFVVRQKSLDAPFERSRAFTEQDAEALQRWSARMQRLFRLTMIALAFSFGVSMLEARGLTSEACWVAYALLLLFLFAAIAVQFSMRCPSCGYLLGLQNRLRAPDHCERCDMVYRANASEDR